MRTSWKSFAAVVVAAQFASSPGFVQFKTALPGYHYEFPRDFFNHADFQTEWWYYTGNLEAADGRKFGFELTFFRSGITRDPSKTSTWDARDLYFAHFAVSDLDRKTFFYKERSNRAGPGIAGADESQQKVWNGNWSVVWTSGEERLAALADGFSVDLSLQSQKPPIIHGEHGVSQKSSGTGRGSHYFSQTRLRASGSLEVASKKYEVTGLAWMDHEFFTHQLDSNQAGWDWLSLQLDDNTELMLFHIRRTDGTIDQFSAGTFVDAQGRSHSLRAADFQLTPAGETWSSPTTHATYPIAWDIRVPSLGIALTASTELPSQELSNDSKLFPSYWEGAIELNGTRNSTSIRGRGYLEMTGYDHPVQMP
jgi:predicted secreted hydrolase